MKSIEIPFQQWIHVVRPTYDYNGKDQEYLCDTVAHMVGKIFMYAIECRYDFVPFVEGFISSDVFRYFDRNLNMYSNSPYHVLAGYDSEQRAAGKMPPHLEQEQPELMEVAYWMGYLMTEWKMVDGVDGEHIVKSYDIPWIIERYQKGDFRNYSIRKTIQAIRAKFDFEVLQ